MEEREIISVYGFWDRKDEDKSSVVSRIDGLAKIAGIIGLGIASRPYWSRLAGRGATFIAEQLGSKQAGRSATSLVENLFSSNWTTPFLKLPHELRTAVASNISAKQRATTFFDAIGNYTLNGAISEGTRQELMPNIGTITKVGNLEDTDVDKIVLNSRAVDKLKSAMEERGIKFNDHFQSNYHRIIEQVVGDTARVKPSKEEVNAYFTDEHRATLRKAFESLWDKQQRTAKAKEKFLGPNWLGTEYEHVTGAHLINKDGAHSEVHNAVNSYLEKVGNGGKDTVYDILNKMEELWGGDEGIFATNANRSGIDPHEKDYLYKKLAATNTGLIYNSKTKQVVSLARVSKEASEHADVLMEELQIPLVPFKFNIPLKMLKFMKASSSKIRNLGNLGSEPELRRELMAMGYSRNQVNSQRGMAIDDKLLTFDMNTGEVKFHDKSFKRIVSYERRGNKNIDNLHNVRDLRPDEARKYLRDFGAAEDVHSKTNIRIYSILPGMSEIQYNATKHGFEVNPKKDANLVQKLAVHALFRHNQLAKVEDLHPTQLAGWLQSQSPEDLLKVDTHTLRKAYRHVLGEASHNKIDMAPLLKKLRAEIDTGGINLDRDTGGGEGRSFNGFLMSLMDDAGDPKKIIRHLNDIEESEIKLHGEISPGLYRGIATMKKNPQSLFEVSHGEGGFSSNQKADLWGKTGVGTGLEKLQEAILSQALRENAMSQLAEELAGGSTGSKHIVNVFERIQNGLGLADPLSLLNITERKAMEDRLIRVGVMDSQSRVVDTASAGNLIGRMFDKNGKPVREQIGKFAQATMDLPQRVALLGKTSNVDERAKIVGDMAESVVSMDFLDTNTGKGELAQLHILDELTKVLKAEEVLKNRFTLTRPFVPRDNPLSPLNPNNFLSITTSMPDLLSIFEDPRQLTGILKKQAARGFGVVDFVAALSDPERALGSFSAATQILVTMPQRMANDIGIGLRGQDRITALRTTIGFYGKRILPLVVGYEAYKNYNANMHAIDMPGIDDMSANTMANVNLTMAGAKDTLGLTHLNQWMVGALPGLDQYFHPRSKDEYEEYLKYGNEEVRDSRGWMIGTRTPLMGGRIKYVRPNAYRRWKSHWTEADNVDISNPSHSFLPNLQNPLAPLNLLLHPNWWEEKHRSDRPYLPGGVGTQSPNQWAINDSYITINSEKAYGPLGIGEIGGGYPIAMTGGGEEITYDRKSHNLIAGAPVTGSHGTGGMSRGSGGSGGYGNLMPQGKPIRLGLHKGIPLNEVQTWSLPGLVTNLAQAVRTEAGLYGAVLQRLPGFPIDELGYTKQDSRKAHSFGRVSWMGEYGEMVGPIGEAKEFFRRFLQPDSESYDAYNALPNNMPSWLPDKFKCISKDTLVEVNGKELRFAKDIKEGDLIRSHLGNLLPVTKIVPRIMDPDEKLYKIKVGGKLSFEFEISEEHPIWTPSGWKEIQHINIGDWMGYPIPNISSLFESHTTIDISKYIDPSFITTNKWIYPYTGTNPDLYTLRDYMEDNNIVYWSKGDCKKVCEELGISWNKNLGSKARRSLLSSINRIPRYLNINSKEWAIFLGYYIAEGNSFNRNITFAFHENERMSYGREVEEAVLKLWALGGNWYQYSCDGKGIVFKFSSKVISEFLTNYIGKSCKDKKLKIGEKYWTEAIRCLINGDGCYCRTKDDRYRLGFKQPYNKELCYHIWQILLSNEIVGSITCDGLDYKGYQAENAAALISLDKAIGMNHYAYTRATSSNGHWYIENEYIYFKLRVKEEIPQQELIAITINGDNSFCLPGLATHNTGDPYMRTPGIGELQLPGDAWERTHPWVAPMKVRGSQIGLSEKEIIEKWLNPLEEIKGQKSLDIVNFGCVDEETEILTLDGWRSLGDFSIGDSILTLNHETGLTEWHPIEYIHTYHANITGMVSIEGMYHSSLTTPNHKWPVTHQYQKRKTKDGDIIPESFTREWTTSNKIDKALNRIILAAEHSDLPIEKTYSDDFVKIVAWYYTEGSTQNGKITIAQSKIINLPYVEEIREILTNLIGTESALMKVSNPDKIGMWREYTHREDLANFALNVHAAKSIIAVAPNKVVSLDFIKLLTKEQLIIFIETSIKADGKNDSTIGQKDPDRLKALELACILLGKRTNIRSSDWIYRYNGKERVATEYILSFFDCQELSLRSIKPTRVSYSGIVWCPTVENSTWCARRKGKVFYTGNSALHLKMQRQLREMGILIGAEVSIYNKEHNLTGTIDAIVKTPQGLEILDFKSQGEKSWGAVPEEYKDQLTTYMATTGIHRSSLVFVDRDDTQKVRLVNVDFDPDRWASILAKVERARTTMKGLVGKGMVSPFESYDLVSRIEILAKVAPGSPEFRDHVKHALDSGLGGFERQRVDQAVKEADRQSQDYNLYPLRYGITLENSSAKVEGFGNNGEIVTNKGVLKLAGVEFDPQAFSFEDPESLLGKYGIAIGKKIRFKTLEGNLNPELMADRNTPVIVGNVNDKLVGTGYARWDEDETTRDPVASTARFGNQAGSLWEKLVHSDNIVTNKFMRVRSPLEQFERGEVYGTDKASWSDPIHTVVEPTISSFIHKPPITAAIQMGLVAAMFASTNKATSKIPYLRSKLAIGGAVLGAALATGRSIYEHLSGNTWTPSRYRKQGEFDEYWDTIKYLKYTAIAESAKKMAKKKEHVDIDKLQNEDRQTVGLGPYAILAIDAERRAKRTMYGYDVAVGTLQDALSTLPARQQQIAQGVIESGSLEERQKFYDLLPDAQQRVLGKFLGVNYNDLPDKPRLDKYFQSHFLPNVDWGGWAREVDLNDIETRSAATEKVRVDQPNRAKVSKARSNTRRIPVPRMDNPTYGNIRNQIHNLLATGGYSNIGVQFKMLPSDSQVVNVNMDLFDNQTDKLLEEIHKQS